MNWIKQHQPRLTHGRILAGAALIVGVTAATLLPLQAKTPQRPSSEAVASANALSEAFRTQARNLAPSVVTITSQTKAMQTDHRLSPGQGQMDSDAMRRFFGEGSPFGEMFKGLPGGGHGFNMTPSPEPMTRTGIGSGVIIDDSGIILTNNHVVDGASEVVVKLADGREFTATQVKTDPQTDLAVVTIEGADNLVAAQMGDSDSTQIGDWVLALGQPFGLEGTVTAGIISAKGRGIGIAEREDFLQTDAAINPGNSGGPLVNLAGEVIGINTAIHSRSGGNNGVGFAIPINQARWVSRQLIDHGMVRRAMLGVGIQQVSHELAQQFGVASGGGVLVTQVIDDSPADVAGLKTGDVIVRMAETDVSTPRELISAVERCNPDSKQSIEIVRDGKKMTLDVVCGLQPESGLSASANSAVAPAADALGLEVSELTPDVAQQLGLEDGKGVVITAVAKDSPAAKAGLRESMVITQVNRQAVSSLADFTRIVKEARKGADNDNALLLLVKSNQGSRFVVLK